MIPQQVLSTVFQPATFLLPRTYTKAYLEDYSRGGTDIGDAGAGLDVKDWHGFLSGNNIMLEASGVPATVVLTEVGITEFQFTFDQAMRPAVAYVAAGVAKLFWYDGTLPGSVTTTLPAGAYNPRCDMDDKRRIQVDNAVSDVIVAYMNAGSLYFRANGDNYVTEYLLASGFGLTDELVQIGMNNVRRFQFRIRPA